MYSITNQKRICQLAVSVQRKTFLSTPPGVVYQVCWKMHSRYFLIVQKHICQLRQEVVKDKQLLQGHQQVHGPSCTASGTLWVVLNQIGAGALLLKGVACQDVTSAEFRAHVLHTFPCFWWKYFDPCMAPSGHLTTPTFLTSYTGC
jgi:hypothetical protein